MEVSMEFRPCIDIHNGQVKQIVGSTLEDQDDLARENFVAVKGAEYYAQLYRENGIKGGHIILLNPATSPYYDADRSQAFRALAAYPGGLQVGGGVNADNAAAYLEAGASHVIVTSYVFQDGRINMGHLDQICQAVGKEHLVLDLSCRMRNGCYYIVTDRWQKFTKQALDARLIRELSGFCDEFLVHAVNVEGTAGGVDETLLQILSGDCPVPITYAGGIGTWEDIQKIRDIGGGRINFTVGSALDLFGGTLSFEKICQNVTFC